MVFSSKSKSKGEKELAEKAPDATMSGDDTSEPNTNMSITKNPKNSSTYCEDDAKYEEEQGVAAVASAATKTSVSHFRRTDLSWKWRYGVALYMFFVLVLLVVSEVTSAIQAILISIPAPADRWSQIEEELIEDRSVITSVDFLWDANSYALAIFLVMGGIMLPFFNVLATCYAWMAPMAMPLMPKGLKRREHLLEFLHVLAKWSFAYMIVICMILVALRAKVPIGAGAYLDVFVVTNTGLDAFIAASIMELVGCHLILYLHRQYAYGPVVVAAATTTTGTAQRGVEQDDHGRQQVVLSSQQQTQATKGFQLPSSILTKTIAVILLLGGLVSYMIGCFQDLFQVSKQRGNIETIYEDFSVVKVGVDYLSSTIEQSSADRWIQILWFILTMALPIASTLAMVLLLLLLASSSSSSQNTVLHHHHHHHHRWAFVVTEIAFAWNCGEVVVLSSLFAVLQIPEFGNGIIDAGCDTCFYISSELYASGVIPLLIGCVTNMGVGFWLHRRLHPVLYSEDVMMMTYWSNNTATTATTTKNGTSTKEEEEDEKGDDVVVHHEGKGEDEKIHGDIEI